VLIQTDLFLNTKSFNRPETQAKMEQKSYWFLIHIHIESVV